MEAYRQIDCFKTLGRHESEINRVGIHVSFAGPVRFFVQKYPIDNPLKTI